MMRGRLLFVAWLLVVWLALWGDLSVANVLSGVVVSVALVLLFPHAGPTATGPIRPLPTLVFLGYFLYKLFEASVVVAWEVITPRNEDVNLGIVAIPVTGASPAVTTIVANAVSLVPGTLTLEVQRDPTVLFVHVLHLREIEAVRRDVMHLEMLALSAFGSKEALANAMGLVEARKDGSAVVAESPGDPSVPEDGHGPEGRA
ncbi:MAG TPA: Na+/H+ antiporter subunit E [Egibacteraceae bacterium]|jgi:multicomponent Na+:H+ antiporter subunit E|nr:Na+/H+ antiporter subunit E [Egibacteraceae bacterium]